MLNLCVTSCMGNTPALALKLPSNIVLVLAVFTLCDVRSTHYYNINSDIFYAYFSKHHMFATYFMSTILFLF